MSDSSFRLHSEPETGAKRIRNTVFHQVKLIYNKVHSGTESLGTTMNLCTLRSSCNSNLMCKKFNSLAAEHVAYSRKPISSEVQPMLLLQRGLRSSLMEPREVA
jgi:hypothetical protein